MVRVHLQIITSPASYISSHVKINRSEAKMMNKASVSLPSIDEHNPLSQQPQEQETNVQGPSHANSWPRLPKLPRSDLIDGSRENYLRIIVPLYEASIKCDWKAAKAIFEKYAMMELEKCSITENGETALHVAASAKDPNAEKFVKSLVGIMEKEDLELQNRNHNTALCLAAAAGNIKTVRIMVEKNKALLTIAGSYGNMMPLYTAALFGNKDVVKYLYNNSNNLRDDGWTTENRGWLLEKCVENDMFDVALEIVKTYPGLHTGNVLGLLARKPEAFLEIKSNVIWRTINWSKHLCCKMVPSHHFLQNELFHETTSNFFKRGIKSVSAIIGLKGGSHEKEYYALPLLRIIWEDIMKRSKKDIADIMRGPADRNQDDKPASRNVDKTLELQKIISGHIVNMHVEIQNNIIKWLPATGKDDQALQLQKLVSEHIAKMHLETQSLINGPATILNYPSVALSGYKSKTYSSRIMFIAAEMGNTKFVVELIRQYPDLIWRVNDDGLSIFHVAVRHRHEGIYNLLYEIGSMKDLITPLKDINQNNMLHIVAKSATKKRLENVLGGALQMQRELIWFKEVEAIIPPSYRERRNIDGLTPYELFTKEHKNLATQGERWLKETASQCIVVATLIATIVFAAAFTVPGGYGQDDGIPIFHSKATFKVFVVADAISLFTSSASLLMFLSILTSRYAERDFLESLPRKLMFGLATLFLSIVTMTVASTVSFFILYSKGLLWMPILICVFAILPVFLYVVSQYGLFIDLCQSPYISRNLFKPRKPVLYYKNPNV